MIERHFESYRASLKRDALDGFDEYAALIPTAMPERYPKVIDYLKYAFANTQNAVSGKHEANYRTWVGQHQTAMIALFERMVEDLLWDYRNITEEAVFGMISENGWNWFKFAKVRVTVTISFATDKVKVAFLPRYFVSTIDKGEVPLDADEAKLVMGSGLDPEDTRPILDYKAANPMSKLLRLDNKVGYYKPVTKLNDSDCVVDWTAPLF